MWSTVGRGAEPGHPGVKPPQVKTGSVNSWESPRWGACAGYTGYTTSLSPAPVHPLTLTCPGEQGLFTEQLFTLLQRAPLSPHQAYVCLDTDANPRC